MSALQAESSIAITALAGLSGAAVAAGVGLALGRLAERRVRRAGFGPPLALGLATLTSFVLTRSWPAFPPAQALHWVFYVALASALLGPIELVAGRARPGIRAALAVAVPLLLLEFQRRLHWGRGEGIAWTGGLAAWLFVTWSVLAAHEENGPDEGTRTMGLAFATALFANASFFAGGGVFALLPGALALATGLCALVALRRGTRALGAAGTGAFVVVYASLLWASRYLYELTPTGLALFSVAPWMVLCERLVPESRGRLRRTVAVACAPLVAGVALALELAAAPPPSPYG